MAAKRFPNVFGPNGEFCGFFINEDLANEWIAGRDGYTVSYDKVKPKERK